MADFNYKFLAEPDTHLVLFFIRKNSVFPVVVEDCSLLQVRQYSEKLERMTNAVWTGKLKSVADYNSIVRKRENPCEQIKQQMFEDKQDSLHAT